MLAGSGDFYSPESVTQHINMCSRDLSDLYALTLRLVLHIRQIPPAHVTCIMYLRTYICMLVEIFEQKRQALIAQESQEVTTETTTVATTSETAPNISEGTYIYIYIYIHVHTNNYNYTCKN